MTDTSKIIEEYLNHGHDFGFTGVSEVPYQEEIRSRELTLDELKSRLMKVEQLIMPLIGNLIKTSESEYIKWPGREKPLRDLADKILKLTR